VNAGGSLGAPGAGTAPEQPKVARTKNTSQNLPLGPVVG